MNLPTHALYGQAEKAWALGQFDQARDLYGRLLALVGDPRGQEYLRRKCSLLELLGKPAPSWGGLRCLDGSAGPIPTGGPLLLFFLQFNCTDCHSAAPWMGGLGRRFVPRGLQSLWVDVPLDDPDQHTAETILAFMNQWAWKVPVGIDGPGCELLKAYRADTTPFAAFVDDQGLVRYLDFPWPERLGERLAQCLGEGGT